MAFDITVLAIRVCRLRLSVFVVRKSFVLIYFFLILNFYNNYCHVIITFGVKTSN